MKETQEYKQRLNILEKHLDSFYAVGEMHNAISDAMKEYAELKLLGIADVSGLFEFSKFLNGNFEYFCNNTEVGDVYKCKRGTGLYSEKEVYDKYLRSK